MTSNFSGAAPGIPIYSNLIFRFELYQYEENDHDLDGVPSYFEDLNGDVFLGNDDTDENGIADYVDVDDDGDGVLTINEHLSKTYIVNTSQGEEEPILPKYEFEVSRSEVNGIVTINTIVLVDSDNNKIFDYLDPDVAVNYNE